MKRYLLAIALILHAPAASAGAFHVFGAGVDSCGSYLNYRKIPDAEPVTMTTLAWFEGYLTAYNKYVARGGDVLAGKFDVDSLQSWLDSYCQANPSDDIVTAMQSFITELKTHKH
jgi:hypothetical protein